MAIFEVMVLMLMVITAHVLMLIHTITIPIPHHLTQTVMDIIKVIITQHVLIVRVGTLHHSLTVTIPTESHFII